MLIKIVRNFGTNFFPDKVYTIKEIREKIIEYVKPQISWSLEPPPSYTENIQYLNPKKQSSLPVRRMRDSYSTAILPLAEDITLRDYYILADKKIRFGRLLEDLDAFAVWIGYKHNQRPGLEPGKVPFNMVTALVDKIVLNDYTSSSDRNIKFTGMTTWVGSTSMEITMQLEQMVDKFPYSNNDSEIPKSNSPHPQGMPPHRFSLKPETEPVDPRWIPMLECKFLMVARDRSDHGRKGVFVNPLLPRNEMSPQEVDLFNLGLANNVRRQKASQESLLKVAPNEGERNIMHELFMETIDPAAGTFKHRYLPSKCRWMEDTIIKTVLICQPMERNLNNTIFGGFLMRQAFELGWVTAYSYMKVRPRILRVEDIVFKQSVSIGSILYLSGQVVFTCGKHVMVKVHSEMKDMSTGDKVTCTILHLLFQPSTLPVSADAIDLHQKSLLENIVAKNKQESKYNKNDFVPYTEDLPPRVIPRSYGEMMLYIMGKRHYLNEV